MKPRHLLSCIFSLFYPLLVFALRRKISIEAAKPVGSDATIPTPSRIFPKPSRLTRNTLTPISVEDTLGKRAVILPAVSDYTKSIQLNPKYADAYRDRGDGRRRTGDVTGANEDYKQANDLHPK